VNIWVDADAFRAAERAQVQTTLVANQFIRIPKSPYIAFLQVESGFDIADNEIVRRVSAGDLVITSDIPLASDAIDKGALALSPRGELYTAENIRGRLNMRDFLDTLRSSGVQTGGPPALSQSDRMEFANHLDRILARATKS